MKDTAHFAYVACGRVPNVIIDNIVMPKRVMRTYVKLRIRSPGNVSSGIAADIGQGGIDGPGSGIFVNLIKITRVVAEETSGAIIKSRVIAVCPVKHP